MSNMMQNLINYHNDEEHRNRYKKYPLLDNLRTYILGKILTKKKNIILKKNCSSFF